MSRLAAAAVARGGVYVHVPFCSAVCPYCDFSVTTGKAERRRAWVERLLREISMWRGEPGRFDTVYFGGGTPSLIETDELARLLEALRTALDVDPDAWIFLEANPEDVDAKRAESWRRAGVRTLSLGLQSFDDGSLRFLGRRHDAAASRAAVETALAAGFSTVSLDLIFGLPGQTRRGWLRELEQAVALEPHHISCYQLTVHDETVFGLWRRRGELTELGESRQAELFAVAHERLGRAGFEGYELSNFARGAAHRSRHNLKYWCHAPYLGLGPSAHSYREGSRWWNLRKLRDWESRIDAGHRPVEGRETLSPRQSAFEALMLGLRTREGVDLEAIETRWGVAIEAASAPAVESMIRQGLLEQCSRRLRPTVAGMAVADALATRFEVVR